MPLVIAAFKIQSVLNGWKGLRLKMAESKRQKKQKGRKVEDGDGMPAFLRPREVVDFEG